MKKLTDSTTISNNSINASLIRTVKVEHDGLLISEANPVKVNVGFKQKLYISVAQLSYRVTDTSSRNLSLKHLHNCRPVRYCISQATKKTTPQRRHYVQSSIQVK